MIDNPLVPLGDLSKPATILIERISAAVGGIFRPYQILRVARAEAEADRIRAEADIEITDLHRRAFRRFLDEEAKRQTNIERIAGEALPLLKDNSAPEDVAADWLTNFFDKCRIVSDVDMQQLWSQLLAGEANSPGTFSRRTVNLLADLEKGDAELFTELCGFGWTVGGFVPLVFDEQSEIYTRRGINFTSLSHLESLGLVQFDPLAGFRRLGLPKHLLVFYQGALVALMLPKEEDNELDLGKVLLTKAGRELAPVCRPRPVEGFLDFVYERWAASSFVPKRGSEQPSQEGG